jgi:hypothetical protein
VRAPAILIMTTLLLADPIVSATAGAFDGNWVALIPPQENCNATSIMTLTMSGGTFQGETRNARGAEAFSGTVDADGNGQFVVYPKMFGTIRFTTDHFDANWNDRACPRHALGDRAPTGDEAAASFIQRKQFQSQYNYLTKQAMAGVRSVNYTALRAAYAYTDQWDPYGNKTAALLDQAAAAAQGKDCTSALAKLDEVLKLDFTIDAAHALRSDCVAAMGEKAVAQTESAIADGLIHSLMDSGDGNTEASAYVVVTQREEMDVLANRRLVLKLRQTQVRGSNGHFYDEVQASSTRDGAAVETVYFDVSSFVDGRKSRLAAIDTLMSSMP